jgi:hypothetical protein
MNTDKLGIHGFSGFTAIRLKLVAVFDEILRNLALVYLAFFC